MHILSNNEGFWWNEMLGYRLKWWNYDKGESAEIDKIKYVQHELALHFSLIVNLWWGSTVQEAPSTAKMLLFVEQWGQYCT